MTGATVLAISRALLRDGAALDAAIEGVIDETDSPLLVLQDEKAPDPARAEQLVAALRADSGLGAARGPDALPLALRREAWDEVRFAGAPESFLQRLAETGWTVLPPTPVMEISPAPGAVAARPLSALARALKTGARAAEVLRDAGPRGVLQRLRERGQPGPPWHRQVPYDLLLEPRPLHQPPRPQAAQGPLSINWVVPAFYPGSGGHMTIFRLVEELERLGHSCRLLFTHVEGLLPLEGVRIRELVHRHFRPVRARCIAYRGQPLPQADVHVATHWDTALVVDRRRRSGAGAYLVQDWEPSFYPAGTQAALAEQTYSLGLQHLTAGPWLEEKLRERGAEAVSFDLAVDAAEYFVEPAVEPPPGGRLAVYLRPSTPRRGFEVVALALAELKRQRPSLEIAAYGTPRGELRLPFAARDLGVLPAAELRRLYCGSTAGLSCSLTNHSLVPQEMWACGLPVVEVDGESTRAVYRDREDVLLAPFEPRGLAARLGELLDDPALCESLRAAGLRRAAELSWARSAAQVEAGLRRAVAGALARS